jgi:hypothetical protein
MRVALVGTGYWASVVYRVLSNCYQVSIDRFTSNLDKVCTTSRIFEWDTSQLFCYTHFFVCSGPAYQNKYIRDIISYGRPNSLVWCEKPLFISLEPETICQFKQLECEERLFINHLYTPLNLNRNISPLSLNGLNSDLLTINLFSSRPHERPHKPHLDFLVHHIALLNLMLLSVNATLWIQPNLNAIRRNYKIISSSVAHSHAVCDLRVSGVGSIVRFAYEYASANTSFIKVDGQDAIKPEYLVPLSQLFDKPLDENIRRFLTGSKAFRDCIFNTSVEYQIYSYLLSIHTLQP